MPTLAEVFNTHLGNTEFDGAMLKRVYKFQVGYITRNPDHTEFFAGNLIGTKRVMFTDRDVARFYDEVLDVDMYALIDDLRTCENINREFKISSDPLNQTLMYMMHRFLTTRVLNDKMRKSGAHQVALIFYYRCMAALLCDYFTYTADPEICQAAYSRLSNRFLIKQLGTWEKVMEYRATSFLDPDGGRAHEDKGTYQKILRFNNDQEIVEAINSGQGAIRSQVKEYYSVLVATKEERDAIGVTTSTYINAEGQESVRERLKGPDHYLEYLRSAIVEPSGFVNEGMVSIIAQINTNTSVRMIRSTLEWLSNAYSNPQLHKDVDRFITLVVIHSCHLIETQIKESDRSNYAVMLVQLKNLYLSSRSSDKDLLEIRKLGERLIKKSSKHKLGNSLIMATRTSVVLYITLRALVGKNAQ